MGCIAGVVGGMGGVDQDGVACYAYQVRNNQQNGIHGGCLVDGSLEKNEQRGHHLEEASRNPLEA
jgi:hypothetical protein